MCGEYGRKACQPGQNPAAVDGCEHRGLSGPRRHTGDITVYDAIRVHFEMWGVQAEHAEGLVETWKRRCPLYGSVATATRDTNVTLTSHTEAHSR